MLPRPPLIPTLVAIYCAVTYYSLVQSSSPIHKCRDRLDAAGGKGQVISRGSSGDCFVPLLSPDDVLSLELWIRDEVVPVGDEDKVGDGAADKDGYRQDRKRIQRRRRGGRYRWILVESCRGGGGGLGFALSDGRTTFDASNGNCTLTLPEYSRWRGTDAEPLQAKFVLRRRVARTHGVHEEGPPTSEVAAEAPFDLTRLIELKGGVGSSLGSVERRNLLLGDRPNSPAAPSAAPPATDGPLLVPHFKYRLQPIVLRVVADHQSYGGHAVRGDGTPLPLLPPDYRRHGPIVYVDETALRSNSATEMAESGEDRPPVFLRIRVSVILPLRDVVHSQVRMGVEMAKTFLGEGEMDEIKYLIDDDRIYRFVLTQVVSTAHLWLDYLAFIDEVGFYVGRADMGGVSASSVLTSFACSLIIFLYLLDGGGTSWLVLVSVGSGVAAGAWKAWRILRPRLVSSFPFVALQDPSRMTGLERKTRTFDSIAFTHLSLLLYPIVIGSGLYGLKHYQYTGWYSWLISNLADAVYTFGFITMCPQLYVNYRLKSVAHLPWKVFLYKIFNTFVDDVFAFLIEMPLKHRLMTLRDDVVFIMFLYQAYVYRVDMNRPNEFGYAYGEKEEERRGETLGQANGENGPTCGDCHHKND